MLFPILAEYNLLLRNIIFEARPKSSFFVQLLHLIHGKSMAFDRMRSIAKAMLNIVTMAMVVIVWHNVDDYAHTTFLQTLSKAGHG